MSRGIRAAGAPGRGQPEASRSPGGCGLGFNSARGRLMRFCFFARGGFSRREAGAGEGLLYRERGYKSWAVEVVGFCLFSGG